MSARFSISLCFQPCNLSFPERRSNPGTTRGPPKVTHHQSPTLNPGWNICSSPSFPQPLADVFFSFFFHKFMSDDLWRDERGWCVLGWGREVGGRWRGQGGGEGIHLIPGSRCIYWRLITQQQSHHALDDFIIWFLGVREGGERSGTKAIGRCWTIVNTGAECSTGHNFHVVIISFDTVSEQVYVL